MALRMTTELITAGHQSLHSFKFAILIGYFQHALNELADLYVFSAVSNHRELGLKLSLYLS